MDFTEGQVFKSYEEFSCALKSYEESGVLYVKNGSAKNYDVSTKEIFPFESLRLVCKQGPQRKTESKGVRTHQSSYKLGCKARICLVLQRKCDPVVLKITLLNLTHTEHDTGADVTAYYPEKCRISLDDNDTNLLNIKTAAPQEVKAYLQKKYEKQIKSKSVYNLKQMAKPLTGSDIEELQKQLVAVKENGGSYHIQKNSEDDSLISLAFQTKEQNAFLLKYPEIVVMDLTYRTCGNLMPLLTIHIIDSQNRGVPVFHAYVANETLECLVPVLSSFKETYADKADDTLMFIVDKDFSEIKSIETNFPLAQISLCAFHVTAAVKKALPSHIKGAHLQDTILNLFIQQRKTLDERKYNELQTQISNLLPDSGKAYFEKNWWGKAKLWASSKCVSIQNFGVETTNHAESFHQKIKVFLNVQNSLPEAVKLLVKYSEHFYLNVLEKDTLSKMTRSYVTTDTSREACDIHKSLVSNGARKVYSQLVLSRSERAAIQNASSTECDCQFFKTYVLPCRHIFKFRQINGLPLFDKNICSVRFLKESLISNAQTSRSDTQPSTSGCTSSIISRPKGKVLKMEDKYRKSMQLLKEFSGYFSMLGTSEFENKLQFLNGLLTGWKSGLEYELSQTGSSGQEATQDVLVADHSNSNQQYEDPIIEEEPITRQAVASLIDQQEPELQEEPTFQQQERQVVEEDAGMANQSGETITVVNLTEDFQFNIPPKVRVKGRPASKQTFTCRKRRKSVPVPFQSLNPDAQTKKIWSAIVKKEHLSLPYIEDESCLRTPGDMGSLVTDQLFNIMLIETYMTPQVFEFLKQRISEKCSHNLHYCLDCKEKDDGELKMIRCDHCLEWYHFECIGMTSGKQPKTWFCELCL